MNFYKKSTLFPDSRAYNGWGQWQGFFLLCFRFEERLVMKSQIVGFFPDSLPHQYHYGFEFLILKFKWLGMRDSNPRMAESKSAALPLGESPKYVYFEN